jgi:sugar phosphate isomerase/epimerase
MKLGIKVTSDSESLKRLADSDAPFAEVWFNVNNENAYSELFGALKQRSCGIGLHFWGILPHSIAPNIAYPDSKIIRQSMALMRRTIDIAMRHGCTYVNIHPGASALAKVNYSKERYDCITDPVETDRSIGIFLEHATLLHEYAKSHGVTLTVETVPAKITDGWYNARARLKPKNLYELPVAAIIAAAKAGLAVANDFCHTAANIISDDANAVYTFLYGTTKLLCTRTRLIHLGFVMRPFNGTDNHDELDNPVLKTPDAVPNAKQMTELLGLFKNRDDVYVIAEPKNHHVKNYLLAKKLLTKAGVYQPHV